MRFKLLASVLLHHVLLLYLLATQYYDGLAQSPNHYSLSPRPRKEYVKMGDKFNLHLDPDATISNTDLLKFVLNDTNTKVGELWNDVKKELDLDRNHNKTVVEQIFQGLCQRIDTLEKYAVKQSSDHSKLLTDLDLELKTVASYHEQLINSLSEKVQNLQGELKSHTNSYHGSNDQLSPPLIHSQRHSSGSSSSSQNHDTSIPGASKDQVSSYYNCELCLSTFQTLELLTQHLQKDHDIHDSASCTICEQVFLSSSHVQHHIAIVHGPKETADMCTTSPNIHQPSPINTCKEHNGPTSTADILHLSHPYVDYQEHLLHCEFCGETFDDMANLNVHIDHQHMIQTYDCSYCDKRFPSEFTLAHHLDSKHKEVSSDDDLAMPQFDGPNDNTDLKSLSPCSRTSLPNNVRAAPYTLNKEKQLSRLGRNATISAFNIDETSPTNINIQCSSGFYQLVAKPTLSNLLVPNLTVRGVPITCSDSITPKLDQMMRNVNAVLHFKVVLGGQQESATVHLHHTQQKVQVQGRGAPWFVENVLKETFEKGAKDRELNIRQINSQLSASSSNTRHVGSTPSDLIRPCPQCKKQIRPNTKLLSMCGNCHQTLHNSKSNPCFLSHVCRVSTSPAVPPTMTPSMSSATASVDSMSCSTPRSSSETTYSTLNNPHSSVSITFVPSTSQPVPATDSTTTTNSVNSLLIPIASTSTNLWPSSQSSSSVPVSSAIMPGHTHLDPDAPSFTPSPRPHNLDKSQAQKEVVESEKMLPRILKMSKLTFLKGSSI